MVSLEVLSPTSFKCLVKVLSHLYSSVVLATEVKVLVCLSHLYSGVVFVLSHLYSSVVLVTEVQVLVCLSPVQQCCFSE